MNIEISDNIIIKNLIIDNCTGFEGAGMNLLTVNLIHL